MDPNFDGLKRLFDRIKSIGFIDRLFRWGSVKNDLFEATADLQKAIAALEYLKSDNSKSENELSVGRISIKNLQEAVHRISTDNEILKKTNTDLDNRIVT